MSTQSGSIVAAAASARKAAASALSAVSIDGKIVTVGEAVIGV